MPVSQEADKSWLPTLLEMAQAEAKPFIKEMGRIPMGDTVDKRVWYKLGAKERYNVACLTW